MIFYLNIDSICAQLLMFMLSKHFLKVIFTDSADKVAKQKLRIVN